LAEQCNDVRIEYLLLFPDLSALLIKIIQCWYVLEWKEYTFWGPIYLRALSKIGGHLRRAFRNSSCYGSACE